MMNPRNCLLAVGLLLLTSTTVRGDAVTVAVVQHVPAPAGGTPAEVMKAQCCDV